MNFFIIHSSKNIRARCAPSVDKSRKRKHNKFVFTENFHNKAAHNFSSIRRCRSKLIVRRFESETHWGFFVKMEVDHDSNFDDASGRLLIDESSETAISSLAAPASTSPTPPPQTQAALKQANSSTTQPNMAAMDSSETMSMGATPKSSRKGHRITEFIQDKALRIKSYFRRRHVPFKRAFDMDLQCGTQSFLMQISDDIEECLYYGHDKLVKNFLSSEGVNLVFVNDFIAEGN